MRLTRILRSAAVVAGVACLATGLLASPASAAPVSISAAQVSAAVADLDASAPAGTAWSVGKNNQVILDVDTTVTGAALAQLKSTAARHGRAVRVAHMSTPLTHFISGGHAIYTGGGRCSLGFNVRGGGVDYFLTAGHCTNIGSSWSASSGGSQIGVRTGTSFPTNDYGIVRYTSSIARPGNIANGQDISSSRAARMGEAVRRHGSTTGNRGGSVTGLNATVRYPQGTVYQMIRTNVCAEPGDSGGPLYAGSAALGLTSGGSGNCSSGGTTFFQPVVEALQRYGVAVY